jgi:hypothetical protein
MVEFIGGRRPAGFLRPPGLVPRVNWRSPLAKGLVGLWYPAGGSLILDLTANMGPLPPSGSPGNGVGPTGYQARDNSTSYWSTANVPAAQRPTTAFSLLYLGQYIGPNVSNAPLLMVQYGGGSAPYLSYGFTWVSGDAAPTLFWNYGVGFDYQVLELSGGAPASGHPYSTVGTVALGGEAVIWVAGAVNASQSATSGSIQYSSPILYLGGAAGSNAGFGFSLGALWNRALTSGEASAVSADGGAGLLEWPWDRLPVRSSAALNLTTDGFPPIAVQASVTVPPLPDYLATGDGSYLDTGDGSYLNTGLGGTGGQAPFEFGAGVRQDNNAPAEFAGSSGSAVEADSNPPIEIGASLLTDRVGATEQGETVARHPLPPVETGAAVPTDRLAQAEALEALRVDPSAPVGSGAAVPTDRLAQAEALEALRVDPSAPVGSGAAVPTDRLAQAEALEALRIDCAMPAEISGITACDVRFPIEAWGTYVVSVTLTFSDGRVLTFPALCATTATP